MQVVARIALLTISAAFATSVQADAEPTTTLVYLCDQQRVVSLIQPDPAQPGQSVSLEFGAERRVMLPAVSASGARYLSADGQWQWWTKGPGGRLSGVDGTALAADCKLDPPGGRLPVTEKSSDPREKP